MGAEQPFTGRLRVGGALRAWAMSTGTAGEDEVSTRELRLDVSAAWSPLPWLTLSALVPLQLRELRDFSLAHEAAWGPGEAEVGARAFVYRDREYAPRFLVSVLGGVKLPTSPLRQDATGRVLALDAQPGSGSVDPFAGVGALVFLGPWSFAATATAYLPGPGHLEFRAGPMLRTSVAAQAQASPLWAFRLGVDTKVEAPGTLGGRAHEAGAGFAAFVGPDVLFSPAMDTVVQLGARIPVLNQLQGGAVPTPVLQLSFVQDLG